MANAPAAMRGRPGTRNAGQEYEINLPALFCLNFLQDDDIKEFSLASNVPKFGALDDCLITLTRNDRQENYAFQLKHKEKRNIRMDPQVLEAESKHDFGLTRYCEEFSDLPNRDLYNYIIYTNAYLNWDKLHNVEKFEVNFNGVCPGSAYFFCPSQKNNNATQNNAKIYNFEVNSKTRVTSKATQVVFKSFFKKLAVYTCQGNWEEIQKLVVEQFQKMFRTKSESAAMSYINIFRFWKLHEYSNIEMTSQVLKLKIWDLILTPHVIFPDEQDEKFAVLENAFSRFDFVFISGLDEDEVRKVLKKTHFQQDDDILYFAKTLKLLLKSTTVLNQREEMEIKEKIGFYQRETPIPIKMSKSDEILTTIFKFKRPEDTFHFVLIGENLSKETFSKFTVFESLYDLRLKERSIYDEIIMEMKIFVKQKQYTYKELFEDNVEVAKKIKIKDIFSMLSENFTLDIEEEILPVPYIPRFLSTTMIKTKSIVEISDDLLIFSDRGKSHILDTLTKHLNKNVIALNEYLKKENVTDCVPYKDKITADDFEQIAKKNPTRNIHHFAIHNEEFLEWMSTKGSIKEVRKCEIVTQDSIPESNAHEKFVNNVNLIVATPGMGKSEILKTLKNTCPFEQFPIMVRLKEHNTFFKNMHNDKEIVEHFLSCLSDNFLLLEVLKKITEKRNLVYFFDGLDELQHENLDNALCQIGCLAKMGFKLWITSRLFLKEDIEDHFNVFSIGVDAFSEEDKRQYIMERLKSKPDVDLLTEEILKNLGVMIENRDIFDIPLQLFMITEILNQSSEVKSNIFVLTLMIQHFLDGRYKHFFNKCKCSHWEDLEHIINDSKAYRLKQYQIGAMMNCFTKEELQSLDLQLDDNFMKQIKSQGDFLGVVTKITNNRLVFNHQVIAEYLSASWLKENHLKVQSFLKRTLLQDKFVYIRVMFDMLFAEDLPAHVAVLYRDIEALKEHKSEIQLVDKGGRSALHLAFSGGSKNAIKHAKVIAKIKEQNEEDRKILLELLSHQEWDLSQVDYVYNWTCFDFARNTNYWLPFEMMLEKDPEARIDLKKVNNWTILNDSATLSYPRLFKKYLEATELKKREITSLLQLATTCNNYKIVYILLDKGVDIHTTIGHKKTVLHMACAQGHLETIVFLLFKEANVDAVDDSGRTPLHLAAQNGHLKAVKLLLDKKANVNSCDRYGLRPLHLAVIGRHQEVVEFMVNKSSANVELSSWNGWGPFHLAINEEHEGIVEFLLSKDIDGKIKMDEYGMKPLHLAALRSNIAILRMILDRCKNVDEVTKDGRTSLHLAAEAGNLKTSTFLVNEGANMNAIDHSGRSVLHLAVISNNEKIVDFLLQRDIDVLVADNTGRTCLHWGCALDNLRIVELLLTKNQDLLNRQNKSGCTALHLAAKCGHNKIVEFLLSKGARIDLADSSGKTALEWATFLCKKDTAELLFREKTKDSTLSVASI